MCTAIASAISASFCGVLNTQRVFGLVGSTMRAGAAIGIVGVSDSAAMSIIASAFGVIVDPTRTSTLSSAISLRALVTAFVVSDPSSSTIQLIFCPATVVGNNSIVFFSGIPSEAAGPVAESVTPIVISASAVPAQPNATMAIATNLMQRDISIPPSMACA